MLNWKIYAPGSAFFAGLTAVLAKIGVRNISSNLATPIRTIAVVLSLLFLGERSGIYQWLGICLMAAGAFIIILK